MQEQTHSEHTANNKIPQNSSVIQEVSFSSVMTKLNLISKQMQVGHNASDHSDPKVVLDAYKLSIRHLSSYQNCLQHELRRYSTAKILLKQVIAEYQSCSKKECLSAKQLSLLVFLLNTLHYLNLQTLMERFGLTCNHYNLQRKIEAGQYVILFAEILPFHLQQLERSRQLYFQKYTQLINVYKQSQQQRANQLIKAITSVERDIAAAKPVLDSIARNLPISSTELLPLLTTILERVKARVAQLQLIADSRQLRVLFLLGRVFELEKKEVGQDMANQAYFRQFRNITVKALPQQMISYLLANH